MRLSRYLAVAPLALAMLAAAFTPLRAGEMKALKMYEVEAAFADVKSDLENAIIDAGYTIDYKGDISGMLDRTGKDVGSTKKVYNGATFMTFCSANLSRKAMEADPAYMGICPYVVFVYGPADKPGKAVVGYRKPLGGMYPASAATVAAVEKKLHDIVKEAAGQ